MTKHLFGLTLLAFAMQGLAQLPETDIFLYDLNVKDQTFKVSGGTNITNRPGYDNQPSFKDNSTILYTSHRDKQTDIYSYSIKDKKISQLTQTPESEYSPTWLSDESFSVVRVEKDSTQRLWKFKGNESPRLIVNVDSVGYHCWLNKETIAVFVLTDPFTLQLIDLKDGSTRIIAKNIGRCLQMIPGTKELSFVEKTGQDNWWIKSWNPENGVTKDLMRTLDGSEDFVWTNDKQILSGKDGKLYSVNPYKMLAWKEIGDLRNAELKDFQRIAISPDNKKIAVVSHIPKP